MSLFTGLSTHFKDYPYRRHLFLVGAYLALGMLHLHHGALTFTFTHTHDWRDLVGDGTMVLALLSSPKGRPFWLFIGLFIGFSAGEIIGLLKAASLTAQ